LAVRPGYFVRMMCQEKSYRVGDKVRVRSVTSYPLPDGLPDGAVVKVLEIDVGRRDVEHNGRRFSVAMANVSAGLLYEVGGQWLPANHPKVLIELNRLEARSKPPEPPPFRSAIDRLYD
jgi:hypothetical protein